MPTTSPRARRLRRLKRQNTLLYRGYTQLAQDHMKLQELVAAAMRAQSAGPEPTPEGETVTDVEHERVGEAETASA